jgi:hypothetical protein
MHRRRTAIDALMGRRGAVAVVSGVGRGLGLGGIVRATHRNDTHRHHEERHPQDC